MLLTLIDFQFFKGQRSNRIDKRKWQTLINHVPETSRGLSNQFAMSILCSIISILHGKRTILPTTHYSRTRNMCQ